MSLLAYGAVAEDYGGDLTYLDALCGLGARGLRVANELDGFENIILNDANPNAIQMAKESYVEEIHGTEILRADIENDGIHEEIANAAGRKVNAIVCDLSPQVIGSWSVDHARQISLNYSAAVIMERVLAPKGNAVFKVFDGRMHPSLAHTWEKNSQKQI